MNQPWYVDAWAVHDGKAFASRRPPDSIEAEATVFMSVPDLQAVPVGRISTALRATRNGFQDGFRDGEGNEIAFDTLAQVRDLVRRAFLIGELGPGSPGAVGASIPPPVGDAGPGSAYLTEVPANQEPVTVADEPIAAPPSDLPEMVRSVAVATILEWEGLLAGQDANAVSAFVGWDAALRRSGAIAVEGSNTPEAPWNIAYLADQWGAHQVAATYRTLTGLQRRWWSFAQESAGAHWSHSHLAVVPLPRLPSWDKRMRRVVEMHTYAVAGPRFWSQPRTTIDIAPSVLVAMIRRSMRFARLPWKTSATDGALADLTRCLRWETLPTTAEDALGKFLEHCLDGSQDTTEDPPPGASAPGSLAGAGSVQETAQANSPTGRVLPSEQVDQEVERTWQSTMGWELPG